MRARRRTHRHQRRRRCRLVRAHRPSRDRHRAERRHGGAALARDGAGHSRVGGGLPLRDASVDAAMSVLSVHHWDEERERGVREMRRVARGPVVVVTYDPRVSARCGSWRTTCRRSPRWISRSSVPELFAHWLGGGVTIEPIPISRDTPDWMLGLFLGAPGAGARRRGTLRDVRVRADVTGGDGAGCRRGIERPGKRLVGPAIRRPPRPRCLRRRLAVGGRRRRLSPRPRLLFVAIVVVGTLTEEVGAQRG